MVKRVGSPELRVLKRTSLIILLFAFYIDALSQNGPRWGYEFHLAVQVNTFSRDFRDQVKSDLGHGLSGGLLFNPKSQYKPPRLLFGVDFAFTSYAKDYLNPSSKHQQLRSNYSINSLLFLTRWKAFRFGKSDFFIDAGLGPVNYSTEIQTPGLIRWSQIKSLDHDVLGYGLGAGYHSSNLGLFLRVLYLWSGTSTYVNRSTFALDFDENATYQTSQTRTSLWALQAGFSASNLVARKRKKGR